MKKISSFWQLPATLVLLLLGTSLQANIISVNISFAGTGNTAIDGEETFGVASLDTVTGGWNNLNWHAQYLRWSNGLASGVDMDVSFPAGRDYFGPGYINTPVNYGATNYIATPSDPGTSLTFYNLDVNFPDGYFFIVYVGGFKGNPGEGVITAGRSSYYFTIPSDNQTPLTPEALLQTTVTTDPGSGNFTEAHYAVFGSKELAYSTSTLTLNATTLYGGAVAICGVQIVSATELNLADSWFGYPVDGSGNVFTGAGFLGDLYTATDSDWVYSLDMSAWVYTPPTTVKFSNNAHFYMNDSAGLQPSNISGNWFYSGALDSWVYSYSETVGSGPAWLYVKDMSE